MGRYSGPGLYDRPETKTYLQVPSGNSFRGRSELSE